MLHFSFCLHVYILLWFCYTLLTCVFDYHTKSPDYVTQYTFPGIAHTRRSKTVLSKIKFTKIQYIQRSILYPLNTGTQLLNSYNHTGCHGIKFVTNNYSKRRLNTTITILFAISDNKIFHTIFYKSLQWLQK